MEGAGIGDLLIDGISAMLLIVGTAFYVIGAVGVNRMPDLFTRMHAASVSETLGVGLLFLGMMLQAGFTLVLFKLVVILALLLITAPLATHALARAALHDGQRPLLAPEEAGGPVGKLEQTDPVDLFPELEERLRQPTSSESLALGGPETYGIEREVGPSNS